MDSEDDDGTVASCVTVGAVDGSRADEPEDWVSESVGLDDVSF